jgi:hypothetical protein
MGRRPKLFGADALIEEFSLVCAGLGHKKTGLPRFLEFIATLGGLYASLRGCE